MRTYACLALQTGSYAFLTFLFFESIKKYKSIKIWSYVFLTSQIIFLAVTPFWGCNNDTWFFKQFFIVCDKNNFCFLHSCHPNTQRDDSTTGKGRRRVVRWVEKKVSSSSRLEGIPASSSLLLWQCESGFRVFTRLEVTRFDFAFVQLRVNPAKVKSLPVSRHFPS